MGKHLTVQNNITSLPSHYNNGLTVLSLTHEKENPNHDIKYYRSLVTNSVSIG